MNTTKERLLLIDGFNIAIAQNSIVSISDNSAQPIGMYITTISQIRNFVDKFKPNKVIFCIDGINAGERRRKLYPSYKGKRRIKGRTSKILMLEGDEEKNEFVEHEDEDGFQKQLKQIYDFLKLLPVTVCVVPYCEADDIISYLALKNEVNYNVTIISTDKDYLQLINTNISVYNWHTKKFFDEQKFMDEFNILPRNYIYRKVILGDSSDEIKNVKTIGVKTFEGIFLNELKTNVHLMNIGDLYAYIESIDLLTLPEKYHKHINVLLQKDVKESLILKYRIMKLEESCLKLNHIEILRKEIEEQKDKQLSKLTARMKVKRDSFNKIYGNSGIRTFNVDRFLQPFVFVKGIQEIKI